MIKDEVFKIVTFKSKNAERYTDMLFSVCNELGVSNTKAVQFCIAYVYKIESKVQYPRHKKTAKVTNAVFVPFTEAGLLNCNRDVKAYCSTFKKLVLHSIESVFNDLQNGKQFNDTKAYKHYISMEFEGISLK